MAAEKDVVVEFSKMVMEHTDTLLKVSGGLVLFNVIIIANLSKGTRTEPTRKVARSIIVVSAIASAFSFLFGFISNSIVLSHMADFAGGKEWEPFNNAELFTGLQVVALAFGLLALVFTLIVYGDAAIEALRKSKLGGGGD